MADLMVDVENLRKMYRDDAGEFDVLRSATFSLKKGEMVSLVGVSGAGKTTLLQILGGLDSFDEGRIWVGGKDIGKLSARDLAEFRNKHIGFVFQFHHLLPDFTAIDNVVIPGLIMGKKRAACISHARELLSTLGLSARETHYPSELSGGERQRVALARALFNEPALILADEPTGNLDKKNGEMLLELFYKANKELGQTFLIATHNSHLTDSTNRVLYIENGAVLEVNSGHGVTF